MKTFKLLLYILLVSFILDKIIYSSINSMSKNVYSGQAIGKVNHFELIKDTTNILIFGSSRANHSLNPEFIKNSSSFNMGVDGSTIGYAATLIKTLPLNKKQAIILHLEPERVMDQGYIGKDVGSLSFKYHMDDNIKKELDDLNISNILQKFYWTIDFNGKLIAILKNSIKPKYNYIDYNGYDPLIVSIDEQEKLIKILDKEVNNLYSTKEKRINSLYVKYLRDIKLFCDTNNKDLIVFTSPLYSDVIKEDNINLDKLLKSLGIEYYDLTDYFKYNNSIKYWKDNKHLSNEGAEIFSNYFNGFIINKKL